MSSALPQGQFCKLMGVSKGRGSQWKKAGMLVFNEDGLVLVDESRARLDARLDMQKRAAANVPPGTRPVDLLTPPPASPPAGKNAQERDSKNADERDTFAAFNKARAEKEQELAISARLDRQEREGELVQRDATYRAIYDCAARSAAMVENMPDKLAKRLAAETNEDRVHEILSDFVRELRTSIASAARDLATPPAG